MSKTNSSPLDADSQNTGNRRRFSGGGMRLSDTEAAEMRRRLIKPMKAPSSFVQAPDMWDRLGSIPVKEAHLEQQRVISASRHNPAHVAFDVLRTRLVQSLAERGWRRVVITSPTKDCGKTFISTNLAISMSRQERLRTVLMDLDLRNPSVAPLLGVDEPGTMGDFLRGNVSVDGHFKRMGQNMLKIGSNVAFGLNNVREPFASEMLGSAATSDAIAQMEAELEPDVVIYDMPPALYHDDVMAFREHYDAVLLVVGGGTTKANEVRELKRRFGDDKPLLGVILNKAEGLSISHYSY
ncbi:MAG: CpsD/CapB family tyrosine-protein kinase [Planktotalea sp.]|uniref:CpsD/CapB family tyrosine-protein kinase n=1 Tax=Planktotalea sp. TaxID=2029877 RepID=UPI003C771667